jgi:hypothetical protein
MTPQNIERIAAELREVFHGATSAREGTATLVRLPEVHFPEGCTPKLTGALVVLDENQPKPQFYVNVIPQMRGVQPAFGTAVVAGDNWSTFSFNLAWTEDMTGAQFVAGMLRRFA